MSGWPDPDVTPVGRAPGIVPPGPSASSAPGPDPFGSRLTVRRRGWARVVVGLVLVVAGLVAAGAGIVQAVQRGRSLTGDAVARSEVEGPGPVELAFTAPEGGDYSIYLVLEDGAALDEDDVRRLVAHVECTVQRVGGEPVTLDGSRQGVSETIGVASSIGWFSTGAGPVARCTHAVDGVTDLLTSRVALVATPGRVSIAGGGVLVIVGGVAAAVVGAVLGAWGWRGSRRPA